jgi:hypothetical protein
MKQSRSGVARHGSGSAETPHSHHDERIEVQQSEPCAFNPPEVPKHAHEMCGSRRSDWRCSARQDTK